MYRKYYQATFQSNEYYTSAVFLCVNKFWIAAVRRPPLFLKLNQLWNVWNKTGKSNHFPLPPSKHLEGTSNLARTTAEASPDIFSSPKISLLISMPTMSVPGTFHRFPQSQEDSSVSITVGKRSTYQKMKVSAGIIVRSIWLSLLLLTRRSYSVH